MTTDKDKLSAAAIARAKKSDDTFKAYQAHQAICMLIVRVSAEVLAGKVGALAELRMLSNAEKVTRSRLEAMLRGE